MKKEYIIIALCVFAYIIGHQLSSHSDGSFAVGYTNSPGDNNMNCTSCHLGSAAQPVNNAITTNIPASGYVPGDTFTITATISHASFNKFGFMLTAEDNANAKVGGFISLDNSTQLILSGNAITHTSSGTSGTANSRVWTFDWVAPAQGTGNITFYAAFNCANDDGNNTGDEIRTSTTSVQEDTSITPPPPPPFSVNMVIQNESCKGFCDGRIGLHVFGGQPPYTISISGGRDTALCPGEYTLIISDASGYTRNDTVFIWDGDSVDKPTISQVNTRLIANSANAHSYKWYVNGLEITGADSSEITISQNGSHVAEAISLSGCTEQSDTFEVVNFSRISYSTYSILPYPNPSAGELFLQISDQDFDKISYVKVFDLLGREYPAVINSSKKVEFIQVLSAGRYIIRIEFSDGNLWQGTWIVGK